MKLVNIFVLVCIFIFITCISIVAAGQPKVFQIGQICSGNPTDPYQVICANFSKNVEEMSNGSIKIDVISDAQLGGEREMIEGMQMGTIDFALLTNVNIGSFLPEWMLFDLPFIFSSNEQAYEVLDGPIGTEILNSLEKLNIKGLAWGEGGFRHMINKIRPIKEPADIKGLKFRSLENPLFIDTYKALESNPTPMAWAETFTGMQQGTIDGLDIPIAVIYANHFYEVADYLSLTGHFYNALILTVSKTVWEKFRPEEQDILLKAAKKAGDDERQFVKSKENEFIEEMQAKGLKVNNVNVEAFREMVSPVYNKYKEKIGPNLVDELFKVVK